MRSSFRQHLLKYAWVLGWLMRDFVWRYRWRAGWLTALRFGGMALQLSTFGLVAKYARMLETDAAFATPWGEQVDARASMVLLGIVGLASLLAMITGSSLILLSSRRMEHLCAEYETFCGKRVLEIAGVSTRLDRSATIDGGDEMFILRLCKPYPRLLRRMTKTMLTSLLPSVLVVAVVFPLLFMLNVWLTALVGILVATSLTAHYRLSVRAAQSSLIIERTGRESLMEFRNVMGQIRQSIAPLDNDSIERPFAAKPLLRNLDAYFTRVTASNESQFISDCLTAVILVVVLVTLGGSILRDGEGWASLLIYLLALRYSMAQLKNALAGFAGIARFFHQIRAYFLFISSEHDPIDTDGASSIERLTVRQASNQPLPGSQPEITLRNGDRMAVYAPLQPTRFQVRTLYGLLFGEDTVAVRAAISNTLILPDGAALADYMASRGQQFTASNGDHETHVNSPPDLNAGTGSPLRIVLAGEKVTRTLHGIGKKTDNAEPVHLNGLFSDCLSIALVGNVQLLEQVPVDAIVVTDGECVCWIGTPDQLPLIARTLDQVISGRGTAVNNEDVDEFNPTLDEAV